MIYIDPPYNTGSDFVYNDDFKESTEEYLENSGQFDEEGNRLEKNLESNGRFHTDWLNMIYPRLKLARNLLSDDGVIFISIDDNEQANLKKICDEIFGEINFLVDLKWANKEGGGSSDSKFFRIKDEHILVYVKRIEKFKVKGIEPTNTERYKEFDKHERTRGKFYLQKLGMGSIRYSESLDYPIKTPDGTIIHPSDNNSGKKAAWRWSKQKFEWGKKNDFIVFKKNKDGQWNVYTKQYFNADNEGNLIKRRQSPLGIINDYSSTQGSKELVKLKMDNIFSYPKPTELLKYLIDRVYGENFICFDFFSGSATTAHAVMELNAEDGGNRKFIMVQLPEETDEKSEAYKAGYKNICEIGKERIRRAGKKILEDNKDKEVIENLDIGFRVLKTDTSNMKDVYYKPGELNQNFLDTLTDNIKEDRTGEDLLFQVMLDLGIPLSSKIETEDIDGKEIFIVDDGYLIASFDRDIDDSIVTKIANREPAFAVFRDSSMKSDSALNNFDQIFERLSPETTRRVI
ncbi:hypothetical protein PEPTYR26121_01749 [Peptoniphilus tyrrelliae]|nr:hypothetical protein PEPTYR26121_01749 [Peptoniphilus tyrrelliae]